MSGLAIYAPNSCYGDYDILASLKDGEARFGWSYIENADLRFIKKKMDEIGWIGLSDEERDCFQQNFLLEFTTGDFVIYVHLPERGKCVIAEITGSYLWRYDDKDFNHRLPVDPGSVLGFDMDDKNIPSNLRSKLNLQAKWWKISLETEFEILTNYLKNGAFVPSEYLKTPSGPFAIVETMRSDFIKEMEKLSNDQWIDVCRRYRKNETLIREAMKKNSEILRRNETPPRELKIMSYCHQTDRRLKKTIAKLPYNHKGCLIQPIAYEASSCVILSFLLFDEFIEEKDKLNPAMMAFSPFKGIIDFRPLG